MKLSKFITNFKQKTRDTNILKSLLTANICLLLLAWTLFLAIPFDLLASNLEELNDFPDYLLLFLGIGYLLLTIFLLNIIFLPVLLVLAYFRSTYIQRFLLPFISLISIFAWFNAVFLVGDYGVFDGRNIVIEQFAALAWIQIFTFAVFALVAFNLPRNSKFILQIAGYILMISVLTTAPQIFIKADKTAYYSEYFTYSADKPNILMFLMDEYQTEHFETILDDDIKKQLEGFTWYPDTAAHYSTTHPTLPVILSGNPLYHEIPAAEKPSTELINQNIKRNGGKVYIVDYPGGASKGYFDVSNQTKFPLKKDGFYFESFSQLVNQALFRMATDTIKPYIYNDGKWLLDISVYNLFVPAPRGTLLTKIFDYDAQHPITVVDDYPITFRYNHSIITHYPLNHDENCNVIDDKLKHPHLRHHAKGREGLCILKKIFRIINKLKKANVFDNTMIVIFADHGSGYRPDGSHYEYPRSAPTLLIKPLQSKQAFNIDNYPAQLADIPKTITQSLNLENDFGGVNLLDPNKPERLERIYNTFIPKHSRDYHKERVIKFSIKGNLRKSSNWSLKSLLTELPVPFKCNRTLKFYDSTHDKYYHAVGMQYSNNSNNWSDGPTVNMKFLLDKKCQPKKLKLNLLAFTPKESSNRTGQVFVNDIPIGNISITHEDKTSAKSLKEFIFDLPALTSDIINLRIDIDNPESPATLNINGDTRQLAFGFGEMEFLSDAK